MFIRSMLALATGLLPAGLSAQATDTLLQTQPASEVVVTATKLPIARSQTAKPVQVISRQELEAHRGSDLAQVLTEQAGILVSGAYSNPGQNKSVFIRGAANEFTLLLINGIPLTDPSGVGGAFDLRLLDPDQIERIEILKGSQSTLYGSDAVAGVINIITRAGATEGIHPWVNLAYGSFNTFEGSAGLSGRQEGFAYRLGLDHTTTDGISEADPDGAAGFDRDGFERTGAEGELSISAGKRWTIAPFVRYATFRGGYDDGAFTDADNDYEAVVWSAGTRIDRRVQGWESSLNYTLRRTDRLFRSALFGDSPFEATSQQADWFNGLRLTAYLRSTAGLYLDHSRASVRADDPQATTLSPYVNLVWEVLPDLVLEGGGRFTQHSQFGGAFSYQALTAWSPVEGLRAYAAWNTGFKAPTLSQLFGDFLPNPELQPQRSRSAELGLEWQPSPQSPTLEIALFDRRIEDLIIFDFMVGYLNSREQHERGLEVSARGRLTDLLSLHANYSFVDGEFLYRRPAHQGLLSLQAGKDGRALLRLSTQYVGSRTDLYFDPADFAQKEATLNEYVLLNVYGSVWVLRDRLQLYADVKNLTGTDYAEVYGFSTPGINGRAGIQLRW